MVLLFGLVGLFKKIGVVFSVSNNWAEQGIV
jgi:hypothetical protein